MNEHPDDLTIRHLAKVVDSSDDAIVSKDLNSTIISWNRAAERMFGYTAAEAIGRSIRMIIPADRQSEEDTVLARVRAGKVVSHFDTIRQHKDGTLIPISLTVSPIYDDRGRLIGASKIARDISERTRLMAAANEHAMNTAKISQVGAMVASTLERETVVQKVTDAATELTQAEFGAFFNYVGGGYTLHALSGASREAFDAVPQTLETLGPAATFRSGEVVRVADVTQEPAYGESPQYFGMPSGEVPVRSYLAVPVRGIGGSVIGRLVFGHATAGMFSEKHERLATGIAAWASVALENARLYAEARDANRMKDDFLAVLSHELRTPLNAIVGYSRLLRGGMLPKEEIGRGFETLERNAAWLTQIVEDVLDVSRIVSGKIRLDVQTVELPMIVDNAVSTMQPAADAKGVLIQTLIDPRVGPVSGDPDRLQQVLWNLVANAVKFTPKGGRVQVRLERVNSHVEMAVSDTGVGIRTEFLPHVFERFRQAEAGPTRSYGGLGLGLAIVRHIVEMHGGSVVAASGGQGQGASFTVRLPVMIVRPVANEARREHPLTQLRIPLKDLIDLHGIRVLAVDDEPDALGLLRVVLETAGAEVTTVSSPSEALRVIALTKPDVLVADLGMPEMDGFTLMERIRSSPDPEIRDVPAAALTAFARSEDRMKALQSGFEMHLAKPVDPGELVASVATLARRAHKPKQLPR